jgi:hypothetical protein
MIKTADQECLKAVCQPKQCFDTACQGTAFWQVTDAELRGVVRKLNDRPRKRLGYRTPAQMFLGEYSGALNTAGAALIA